MNSSPPHTQFQASLFCCLIYGHYKDQFLVFQMNASFKAFKVGETVCCRLHSITEQGDFNPAIFICANPEVINYGYSRSNVKVGDLLIASVECKYNEKYVMSTGIQGVTAFLKETEAIKYIEERDCDSPLSKKYTILFNC